jgi:hypothetical protein
MMDVTRTQSAYRPLPRLETNRSRPFFADALEAMVVPCCCLVFAAFAYVGTYCWLLHR